MEYQHCIICGNNVEIDGKFLVNGKMYHANCYKKLLDSISQNENQISLYSDKRSNILNTINSSKSLFSKIKLFFGSHPPDIDNLNKELKDLDSKLSSLETLINQHKEILKNLYSFWPSYPPDWEERRKAKLSTNPVCEECGKDKILHIHHKIRIGNGGTHNLTNLLVLCKKCHRKRHPKRHKKSQFSYDNNFQDSESFFVKRLAVIHEAISQDLCIRFSYEKYDGSKSVRTIKPSRLEEIGESPCIHGWCFLRNAERVFAVKRMRKVKIESNDKMSISYDVKKPSSKKRKLPTHVKTHKPKTAMEDMLDQLDQHDLENLRLMGYDSDE